MNCNCNETSVLLFKKLSDKAFTPVRASEKAAGFDLMSSHYLFIPGRGRGLCKTDIQISLPKGCYGRIAPRSGLALKGIDVVAGVVDEDYRGNVGVVLYNSNASGFEIKEGDRIAQLICEKIFYPYIVEVNELNETKRGSGGFGSTGIN